MKVRFVSTGLSVVLVFAMMSAFVPDAWGQRFLRRTQRQTQPNNVMREAYTFKIKLEYSSGSNEFWEVEEGADIPVNSKPPINERGEMLAGGPTVDTYTQNKNKPVVFRYSNGMIEAETKLILDNAAKTVKLRHNLGSSDKWELVRCDGIEVKKTVLEAPRPNAPGSETEEMWTFGKLVGGKKEATAVFRYDYHGRKATQAVIQISK